MKTKHSPQFYPTAETVGTFQTGLKEAKRTLDNNPGLSSTPIQGGNGKILARTHSITPTKDERGRYKGYAIK